MFLLFVSRKSGYNIHSVHATKEVAEQWVACKTHDGEDVSIAEMNNDVADQVRELLESSK